jgi:gamma-glutamyltranspeptidase/glutathione hydrolase
MKLAFADRAHWLGDADFAKVPMGLIDKDYAQSLAKRIDVQKSSDVQSHGNPLPFDGKYFNRHTTHIAAADSEGYWVAITATINTTFGSKVIVPGTGVILNNEMDDFSSQPGVPNAFGLIGAENNAIAPLKRPLSSMSPTIVLDQRAKPVMTVGAAGGPKIITQVLLAITRCLDLDQSLDQAISGPRFHHQWRPDRVLVESATADEVVEGLRNYGHNIEQIQHSGITQAIGVSETGKLIGVHDPRVPGKVGHAVRVPVTVPE